MKPLRTDEEREKVGKMEVQSKGGEAKKSRVQTIASKFGGTARENREREREEKRVEKDMKEREQRTKKVTEKRKLFERNLEIERKVQAPKNNHSSQTTTGRREVKNWEKLEKMGGNG